MKVAGLVLMLGVDLLIIQPLWPFHHRFARLPSDLALIVFAVAAVWGLVAGTPRIRLAIFLVLISLTAFAFVLAVQPGFMAPMYGSAIDLTAIGPILAAIGTAFLVLAVAAGIRVYIVDDSAKA